MLGVEICNLPETGGSLTIVMGGLFALIAGVIAVRWVLLPMTVPMVSMVRLQVLSLL